MLSEHETNISKYIMETSCLTGQSHTCPINILSLPSSHLVSNLGAKDPRDEETSSGSLVDHLQAEDISGL